jgi:hypothetical protein
MHQYLLLLVLTKLAVSLRRALDAPALSKVVLLAIRGEGLDVHIFQDTAERFVCSDALWSSFFACLNAGG